MTVPEPLAFLKITMSPPPEPDKIPTARSPLVFMAQLDGIPTETDKFLSSFWGTLYSEIWSAPATIQKVFFP